MKPKVLICVLTGTERTHWINPMLLMDMLTMARDPRFEVAFQPVCNHRPFEYARNRTIALARDLKADWLISFDNDNYVDGNPLDVLAEADGKDVIGLTYGVGGTLFPSSNEGAIDGNFREEPVWVGGAMLIIRNAVWEKIPRGPWFRWEQPRNELLAPDVAGCAVDEIEPFCNLVRQHGFRVWTHRTVLAGHLKTVDITALANKRGI
jgi:hypothetical protein